MGIQITQTFFQFAANDNPHPFEFTGDFVFQPQGRDEKMAATSTREGIPILQDIVENILERLKTNRNVAPKHVVVYRNGCSEGQFANIMVYEVPFIQSALKKQGFEDTKLTFLVPNKQHNVRFVPADIRVGVFKCCRNRLSL